MFNVNDFINNLGNIKCMKAFELLDRISILNIKEKKLVLDNHLIRSRLKDCLQNGLTFGCLRTYRKQTY